MLCYRIRYGIFECSEELAHRVSAKALYKPAKTLRVSNSRLTRGTRKSGRRPTSRPNPTNILTIPPSTELDISVLELRILFPAFFDGSITVYPPDGASPNRRIAAGIVFPVAMAFDDQTISTLTTTAVRPKDSAARSRSTLEAVRPYCGRS